MALPAQPVAQDVAAFDIMVIAPVLELLPDYFQQRAAVTGKGIEQEIIGAVDFYLEAQQVLITMDRSAQGST